MEVIDTSEGHESNSSDNNVDSDPTRERVISQERVRDYAIQNKSASEHIPYPKFQRKK